MSLKTLAKRLKGGPGSGNFGHGGRPGKRGGSSLGKGGGILKPPTDNEKKVAVNRVKALQKKMGAEKADKFLNSVRQQVSDVIGTKVLGDQKVLTDLMATGMITVGEFENRTKIKLPD